MSEAVEAGVKREHTYHAEATVLSGHLHLPLEQAIKPQAFVKLSEQGGYLAQQSHDYRLEAVIRHRSAYTQVAGNREIKDGHGWSTLVTSVVEGLNILDVITADRVVAQISTEHPLVGYVPSITFLGTRFENLRIAGHPVNLKLDLNIFGDKAANDAPYTRDSDFQSRVVAQHDGVREQSRNHQSLFATLFERYNRVPKSFEESEEDQETVECSLVNQAEGDYPGRSFGHVIEVPHFGTIYLATLHLREFDYKPGTRIPRATYVSLTMIEAVMGCIAHGTATVATARTNGTTKP